MPRFFRLVLLVNAFGVGLLGIGLQLHRADSLQLAYLLGRENPDSGQRLYQYIVGTDYLSPLTSTAEIIQPARPLADDHNWIFFRATFDQNPPTLYRVHTNGCCLRAIYSGSNILELWQPAGARWIVFQTPDGLYRVSMKGHDLQKIADSAQLGGRQYRGIIFSPDRSKIAFITGGSPTLSIHQLDLTDGSTQIATFPLSVSGIVTVRQWVGEWIILDIDGLLYRVRLSGEGLTRLTQNRVEDWNERLAGVLTGEWLEIRATNPTAHLNTVSLLSLHADSPNWTRATNEQQLGPVWFPNEGVAVYSEGSRLYQLDFMSATRTEIVEVGRTIVSLHGNRAWVYLQAAGPNRSFRLYRVRPDGRDFQPLTDLSRFVNIPRFSPDMQSLLLIEGPPRNKTSRVIYSGPSDGETLHQFLPGLMEINFVRWGPRLDKQWSPLLLIGIAATILGIALSTKAILRK